MGAPANGAACFDSLHEGRERERVDGVKVTSFTPLPYSPRSRDPAVTQTPPPPEFLALKHESRILRHSSNPVCGSWKSKASSPWAKQPIMEKPHTVLDDCLRILLACFRKRMSATQPPPQLGFVTTAAFIVLLRISRRR